MLNIGPGAIPHLFGGFMFITVIIRILIAAILIIIGVRRHKRFGGCRNSALNILGEKYACGEITEEEYFKRKTVLTQK